MVGMVYRRKSWNNFPEARDFFSTYRVYTELLQYKLSPYLITPEPDVDYIICHPLVRPYEGT
jgi:hypothetical protein